MRYEFKNLFYKTIYLVAVIGLLLFSETSNAQSATSNLKVSIAVKDVKLIDVIRKLSSQHQINFVYDRRHLPLNELVTLSADNQPLSEVLRLLVTPFQLEFAIYGRQVSVYRTANQKFTISGYLKDSESDEALIGANIYDPITQIGTVSNQYGFFSLRLPAGKQEIVYSYLGYKERRDSIPLFSNIIRTVKLKAGNQLTQIVVVPPNEEETNALPELKLYLAQTDAEELSAEQVNNFPALLGENDILKTFTLLPGVQSGNEGDNGVSVRGGGRDQNLVLMDGAPIYNPYHLFGFVSLFNPEAVHKVLFYKSGFPSRYNGRLSSVMDVKLKDGNMKRYHGGLKMGLLATSLTLQGPLVKDKVSFIGSLRRPILNLLVAGFRRDVSNYSFNDYNFKVTWKLNDRNRLYSSAYSGNDRFTFIQDLFQGPSIPSLQSQRTRNEWGNKAASLNWSSILTPRLFSNVSVNYSNYFNNSSQSSFLGDVDSLLISGIPSSENFSFFSTTSNKSQASINLDLQYNIGTGKELKIGGSFQINNYDPLNINEKSGSLNVQKSLVPNRSDNLHFYVEADLNLTNRIRLRPGIHIVQYSIGTFDKILPVFQPRFLIEYQVTPNSKLNFNYTRMVQFDHYLSDSGLGFPTDLWVPSFKYAPETANQLSIGYKQKIYENLKFEFSAYYKKLRNLLEYKENASYLKNGTEWFNFVEVGTGESKGVEFTVARLKGKTTGWVSYTLSSTERQFTNINNGNPYPYRFDKRHDVALAINHKLSPRVEFGAVWAFNTGNPVTLPVQQYTSYTHPNATIHFTDERNNYRNPVSHRLDISFDFHKLKVRTLRTWSIGCYNLYGNFNSYSTILDYDGEFYHSSLSAFPVPYFTYKTSF